MNAQTQLPAHLQNRASRNLSETAAQGLGGALPPHISIQGNAFCLIDATGAEQPVTFRAQDGREYNQPYLDACIVDISDVLCKRYYGGKKWTADSKDPPVCWSANGVGPSREAPQPQCRTCAECPNNVRGSTVSQLSGVAIKACRDEKWIAVTLPGFGKDMLFQFVLTPGSFQNWKAYVEKFKGQSVDISDVVTRFEFEQGKNGVLEFDVSPAGYIDAATADLRERVLAAKTTDIFVGRTDQPIQMLAAPVGQAYSTTQNLPMPAGMPAHIAGSVPLAPASTAGFQPGPAPGFAPQPALAAPPASFQPQGPGGAPVPQQPAEPARRRRRSSAEVVAANAAAQQPAPPLQGTVQAPFRPAAPPAAQPGTMTQVFGPAAQAPAGGQPNAAPPFGVGAGAPPNADLQAMLNQTFGPAPQPGGPR